jgi:hypothetical protein
MHVYDYTCGTFGKDPRVVQQVQLVQLHGVFTAANSLGEWQVSNRFGVREYLQTNSSYLGFASGQIVAAFALLNCD